MEYAHPEVLVDTQWVVDHLKDSEKVRIAEVDYDRKSNYELGHIPGSVLIDWKQDINDPVNRNVWSKQACEDLLQQKAGLDNDTNLILYGDFNNWFAAFAFWVFKYYAYKDVRLMDGGRKKSLVEDRPVSKDIPQYSTGLPCLGFIGSYSTDENSLETEIGNKRSTTTSQSPFLF